MKTINRCINLDWLEVTALEPITSPRDPEFFQERGLVISVREYGTRVWGEVFTIEGSDHLPFIEVRRAPKSEVIACNVVHLRFVNRVCYFPDAARLMAQFMETYNYDFLSIYRVDVCLDFECFDFGDKPADFMRRFMSGRYAKINQANIHAHGSDDWSGRVWNSVSWGAPTSDIGTKFYNKTLELFDPITKQYTKPYIRQAWQECGLIDDYVTVTKKKADGTLYHPEIWRVEFSIRSSVKNWFTMKLDGDEKAYQSVRNTLDMYDSRDKLLVMFAALSQHYFHFKHSLKTYNFYKEGHSSGNAIRKDRCPDKMLFDWHTIQQTYKVAREAVSGAGSPSKQLVTLLARLKSFRDTTINKEVKQSATIIIDYLEHRVRQEETATPLSREEINALQYAMKIHSRHPQFDPAYLLKLARLQMKLRDDIDPFF